MTPTVQIDMRRATWRPEIGISRYSTMLVKTIASMPESPVRLELLDLDGGARIPGVTTRIIGTRTHFLARLAQEQLRIPAATGQGDLLHLPWYEGPVAARCPLVVNVHDLDTLEPHGGYSRRFRVYYNTLLRLYIRSARKIIVPSQASLSALQRRWPGRPYVHIPYGIDPVMFRAPGVARAPEPTILYCGGYGARKRIPDLIEAVVEVAQAIPAARLVLTGDPPPWIRSALQQLPRPEQVECVGIVPLARLVELYAEAWVVAYPSSLEGFGFPVLEAFAAGTPIVAASGGSIPELAGDAAMLVPPGSAAELAESLLRVLRDEKLAAELTARGLRRVEAFTWQETAARTLETYAEALA